MTFPFTRAQFESKKRDLAPTLGQLSDQGLIFYSGVKLEYSYHEPSNTLTLTVIQKPSLLPMSTAESQIRSWLLT